MGALEHHGRGRAPFEGLEPAQRAEAPAVPGLEAREAEFRACGHQVVAAPGGELEESSGPAGAGLDLDPDRPFVDRPRRRA